MYNHYEAAFDAIYTLEPQLDILQQKYSFADGELASYVDEERKYLQALKEPLLTTSWKAQYIQVLNDLDKCRSITGIYTFTSKFD